MIRVGLTGGIGTGKSVVARIFECLKVPVYDADTKAKNILDSEKVIRQLQNLFGIAAIGNNGLPDRKYIASQVFADPEKLARLNKLIHPLVREDFEHWCEMQKAPYVIEEAAILFESGFNRFFDITILVTAPEEICIDRVMKRDGVSREAVKQRMRNQWPEARKRELAGYILVNDGKNLLLPEVLKIHNKLCIR